MKRFLAMALSIVMVFSLSACDKENKAEKYCFNCGEGISKKATYCEYCGTEVSNTKTENKNESSNNSSTDNTSSEQSVESKVTETSKPAEESKSVETSKPTETSKPATTSSKSSTPKHKHSYSKKIKKATCTKKGYTIYTCSCGKTYKDNYKNPSHSYSQYLCTKCGVHDKEHTYEFLVEFVKKNGEPYATEVCYDIYSDDDVCLIYNTEHKDLYIYSHTQNGKIFQSCTLSLKTFIYVSKSYSVSDQLSEVTGFIDAKNYTNEAPLDDVNYKGSTELKNIAVESARLGVAYLVAVLSDIPNRMADNVDLTMADMGFYSY